MKKLSQKKYFSKVKDVQKQNDHALNEIPKRVFYQLKTIDN